MTWILLTSMAFGSGRFAVPPQLSDKAVESPTRLRARPTLLNPPRSTEQQRWTLGELTASGRYPAQVCTRVMHGPHLAYDRCVDEWQVASPPIPQPTPWWAFWR